MSKINLKKSAIVALAGLSVIASGTANAKETKMEKCYGVVKAGKNDCAAAKKGSHSCAGGATVDGDKAEWILLPEGTCERLVNGSKVAK